MTHGLIVGKFYPPHLGHHLAIREAAQRCDRLSVLVMASFAETIALDDRVNWLRAEHAVDSAVRVLGIRCDAPVDLDDPTVWTAQIAAMSAALRCAGAGSVDVVFSADAYGAELAARLGATFQRLERPAAGPSGSAVRRDLAGSWLSLAPATRAGLATRVIVVGAESTGTTTVSRRVAEHYKRGAGVWSATQCVGEFGRDYTELKWSAARRAALDAGTRPPNLDEIVWDRSDFDMVATEQTRRENAFAETGSPILICDTDAFATAIWERRYLGTAARTGQPWTRPPALPRRDLYLVTDDVGVPWQDDGMREGDQQIRAAMTGWFIDALTAAEHSWVLLTGSLTERLELAIRTIDPLLAHRTTFGAPLAGPGFAVSA